MIEYKRSPLPVMTPLESAEIPADFADDGGVWLVKQAADLMMAEQPLYALIHLDDGVLWGRADNGKLTIPDAQQCDWVPQLRSLTIQQCRLFSHKGELFIWRIAEGKWRGRKVLDDAQQPYRKIEEPQLLLGNRIDQRQQVPSGFMAIYEASTGLRQVVPRTAKIDGDNRLALVVYHYLSEDDDGQANIKCSRLVDLIPQKL
jgi:CRISPR-associated protein (TIGR03984 family)